jgi:four helix bundle protein
MADNELQERLFRFAIKVIKMLRKLKGGSELLIIRPQLIKSSTSSGANYDEAQGAVSKADFANKVGISLKEMRESHYWLKVLNELYREITEVKECLDESIELKNILGTICFKVKPR